MQGGIKQTYLLLTGPG